MDGKKAKYPSPPKSPGGYKNSTLPAKVSKLDALIRKTASPAHSNYPACSISFDSTSHSAYSSPVSPPKSVIMDEVVHSPKIPTIFVESSA